MSRSAKSSRIGVFIGALLIIAGISLAIVPSLYSRTVTTEQYKQEADDFYERIRAQAEREQSGVEQTAGDTFDLARSTHDKIGILYAPSIGLTLPIYRGDLEENLMRGAGTMLAYGDITGEKATHPVLTAHNGMPEKILFTNIDKMNIGDPFYVLSETGNVLSYSVDAIHTVLPTDVSKLGVTTDMKNNSYMTLLTCTPEGINSHRLLVRGVLEGMSSDIEQVKEIAAQQTVRLTNLEKVGLGLIAIVITVSGVYCAVCTVKNKGRLV